MMTLDEAITHCDEVANNCNNKECALNHQQLKNWLIELKTMRSKEWEEYIKYIETTMEKT